MSMRDKLKKLKNKNAKDITKYCYRKILGKLGKAASVPEEEIYKILLLTNRDSDNVGDQVIEACDISLISTVMKNLGIDREHFTINSRAAAIISQKYLATKNSALLKTAEDVIKKCDIIIFGGAPLFNYSYQNFYERTAVTLEIAKKYEKPVIFSAIGVENYTEGDKRCERLKNTLNFECVKQITTRDNFEALQKFKENEQLVLGKVSDPAVFTQPVFEKFVAKNKEKRENDGKRVGVFVIRSNGFWDNGFNFTREDAAELWVDTARELEAAGYDYELLTSGHFGDEAFLDYLIKQYGIDAGKCVFNINAPETLIKKISSYDAVITCRLHPSIISFSLEIPAVGIVWNSKVTAFYESIGYADRLVPVEELSGKILVEKIKTIINSGVNKEESYLMSVYNTLFEGISGIVCPDNMTKKVYEYEELINNIVVFEGTSEKEKQEKLKRKFRRTYGKYNELFDKNIKNRREADELTAKYIGYTLIYNAGVRAEKIYDNYDKKKGKVKKLGNGHTEYWLTETVKNSGETKIISNGFERPGYEVIGWHMRLKNDNKWYWYMDDGKMMSTMDYVENQDKRRHLFEEGQKLPFVNAECVTTVVLEAVWRKI